MPDNFITLSNRLLNRAPVIGILLAQQFVNDSWRELQSRRAWSWRRKNATFAPPTLYQTGTATTNVASGNPTLITGSGTTWTPQMVGRQIRLGGLLYPYYDIVGYVSPTALLIGQPWAGDDVTAVTYQILQCYYPVPQDFGMFYDQCVVSIKDSYRLWTTITQNELAMLDPQRTNQGQTYAVVFRDYTEFFGGLIGPVITVGGSGPAPISTTSTGFSYVANATYIVQVVGGGASGVATFQWMRAGQTSFTGPVLTDTSAVDLMDGVQVYWPSSVTYVANDLFVINCQSLVEQGTPRYELWPSPTVSNYLYPYLYMVKEYDLTPQAPSLPPFVANRGEVLLEMALAKCATYPGPDEGRVNPYYNLTLAKMHEAKAMTLIFDLERNDEEVGESNISYVNYPYAPAPWATGQYQQTHAPFLS